MNDRVRQLIDIAREERELRASLRRVTDCLATFVREHPDPGTEALAALNEAQRLLKR